jgi:hypothetical protein
MQKLFQGLDLVFAKGGFDRMRTIGCGFQHFPSMGVELFDHIPHRLIIAIQLAPNLDRRLLARTGSDDLAAANFEAIFRAQALL